MDRDAYTWKRAHTWGLHMARRSLTGQLNMFDYFRNIDANASGEVEMVSLMPWDEEPEPEVVPEAEEVPEPEVMAELEEISEPEMLQESKEVVEPEVVPEPIVKPEQVKKVKSPKESKKSKSLKISTVAVMMEESTVPEEPKSVEEPKPVEEPKSVEEPTSVEEPKIPKEAQVLRKPVKTTTITGAPVMSRNYVIDGKTIEIAYINYNKVRITEQGKEPEVYEFTSSKEAVDYYVQRMQELEPEE